MNLSFFKSREIISLIALALLLRLLIIPFYFHPDIKTYHFQASFLKQGVVDIYSYLAQNKTTLPTKEEFVYFPLTYFFLGSYQIMASPFLGSQFQNWLADSQVQTYPSAPYVFRYLFILKLPYLIFDLLIAVGLVNFFNNQKDKKRALIIWLFNPISLILIYVYSNVDIFPVFFSLLSLTLAKNRRLILSALMLAIGVGFKAYPIIFLPIILLNADSIKLRLKILATVVLTLGLINGLFLTSAAFLSSTVSSGLTTRLLYPGLSIGFGESLMLGLISLGALGSYILIKKQLKGDQNYIYYLSILLLIFSFSHFHIQWVLWILPMVIILNIYLPKFNLISWVLCLVAFIIPILYEDSFMLVALLGVISPIYKVLPTPFAIVSRFNDPYIFQSGLHSLLAGGSLILVYQLLRGDQSK